MLVIWVVKIVGLMIVFYVGFSVVLTISCIFYGLCEPMVTWERRDWWGCIVFGFTLSLWNIKTSWEIERIKEKKMIFSLNKAKKKRREEIDAEIKDLEEELENIKAPSAGIENDYRKTIEILEYGIKRQGERIRKTDAQGIELDGMERELEEKKGWLRFLKTGKK
ncbi:MAG: hypothetical protein E3J60_04440 [Dehalococcoidia bacterium]|nr:MAG: hypothetical protein E3J60_04440 [Dehalococcoidia bacterium]